MSDELTQAIALAIRKYNDRNLRPRAASLEAGIATEVRRLIAAKDAELARVTSQRDTECHRRVAIHRQLERTVVEQELMKPEDAEVTPTDMLVHKLRDTVIGLKRWKAGSEKLDKANRLLIQKLQAELAEARKDYDELVTEQQGED